MVASLYACYARWAYELFLLILFIVDIASRRPYFLDLFMFKIDNEL